MNLLQSKKNDLHQCLNPSTQQLYTNVCMNSSNPQNQCVQNLTNFCQQQTYTSQDFENQKKILNCYVQQCPTRETSCLSLCNNQIENSIKKP